MAQGSLKDVNGWRFVGLMVGLLCGTGGVALIGWGVLDIFETTFGWMDMGPRAGEEGHELGGLWRFWVGASLSAAAVVVLFVSARELFRWELRLSRRSGRW